MSAQSKEMQAYHCDDLLCTAFWSGKPEGHSEIIGFWLYIGNNCFDGPPVLCLDKGGGTTQEYLPYRESQRPWRPPHCYGQMLGDGITVWPILGSFKVPYPLKTVNVLFKVQCEADQLLTSMNRGQMLTIFLLYTDYRTGKNWMPLWHWWSDQFWPVFTRVIVGVKSNNQRDWNKSERF